MVVHLYHRGYPCRQITTMMNRKNLAAGHCNGEESSTSPGRFTAILRAQGLQHADEVLKSMRSARGCLSSPLFQNDPLAKRIVAFPGNIALAFQPPISSGDRG